MHLVADAVAGEFTHHSVAVLLAIVLHGRADVAKPVSGHSLRNAAVERLARHIEQRFHLRSDLTHTESVARITTEAVEQRATIDRDDVTVLEHGLVVGYAMHHNIVDRCADAGGERRAVRIGEALEGGLCPMVADELLGHPV